MRPSSSSLSVARTLPAALVSVTGLMLLTALFFGLLAPRGFAQEFSPATDITAQEAYEALQKQSLILVDVRTPGEWRQTGIAEGAVPISMQDPAFIAKFEALRADNPDKPVAFICASGRRSGIVQNELARRGYKNVFSVYGGTTGSSSAPGWIAQGLPVTPWSGN